MISLHNEACSPARGGPSRLLPTRAACKESATKSWLTLEKQSAALRTILTSKEPGPQEAAQRRIAPMGRHYMGWVQGGVRGKAATPREPWGQGPPVPHPSSPSSPSAELSMKCTLSPLRGRLAAGSPGLASLGSCGGEGGGR